jgi:hypothetical protein
MKTPTKPCQAIVDDFNHLAFYASVQRIRVPGDKPCSRKGTEQVKHLCLCPTHARMAREGLIDEGGRVAPAADRANVRKYPRQFPRGLGLGAWAREDKVRSGGGAQSKNKGRRVTVRGSKSPY